MSKMTLEQVRNGLQKLFNAGPGVACSAFPLAHWINAIEEHIQGDEVAVPVAVQTRYQGPNKTVNTDWRPCSFAHAQAVKDARCDVTEIRYLYTHPARSGVVSDEDAGEVLRRFEGTVNDGGVDYLCRRGRMRAALESYERNRK